MPFKRKENGCNPVLLQQVEPTSTIGQNQLSPENTEKENKVIQQILHNNI